jgi:dTDP-4-amino-4,6-dideoxygalactose transaminase
MIGFAPPRIDEKVIEAVSEALRSGWITTGPRTKLLEQKLAHYCRCPSVICLNSATAGLELMLRWYGVGEGDEVILPAYTYAATANVVVHCGAIPVLADVNADDFCISIAQIKKLITPKTKVIMPVDFGGMPCDYDALNHLIKESQNTFLASSPNQQKLGRILLLADAAHSLGAVYKGNKTGLLADASVFSFHAVKNLSTAEGGAVALRLPHPFDNNEIYKELNILSLHGQNKDALAKEIKGGWKYDIVEAGFKCNMTDIAAAIGLVEIERYEEDTLKKRRDICTQYQNAFSGFEWAELPLLNDKDRESSYHLYPLRIKGITENVRDEIIKKVLEKEVAVNVHFMPLPMLSFYKKSGYNIKDYPISYNNYSREISLPVFYNLTAEQVQTVINAVVKSIEEFI